jgi:hypothetical protein
VDGCYVPCFVLCWLSIEYWLSIKYCWDVLKATVGHVPIVE